MSDVVIVTRDTFRNGYAGHVPYGAVLDDDDENGAVPAGLHSFESMFEGAVPAVDWRGVDQVDSVPGPKRRGRPRKTTGKVG